MLADEKDANALSRRFPVSNPVVHRKKLSRSMRMTERREFQRLFDQPQVFRGKMFQAFYKENNRKTSRIGITVKGRVSSVWRARIKRTIREWFRLSFRENHDPVDLNIVVKAPEKMEQRYIDHLKLNLRQWK